MYSKVINSYRNAPQSRENEITFTPFYTYACLLDDALARRFKYLGRVRYCKP